MSKYRRAAKIDSNQLEIVKALRQIPHVSVQTGVDDILVGYRKQTYWFEIKSPECANRKGEVFKSAIKPSQHLLMANWSGHYSIVTTLDQIIAEVGICQK
jgi:hypothetical protein